MFIYKGTNHINLNEQTSKTAGRTSDDVKRPGYGLDM